MANERRLIELIEYAGDMALSRHIPLTAEMIAEHLIKMGVEIPVHCCECRYFEQPQHTEDYFVCTRESGGICCPDSTDSCSYGERKSGTQPQGEDI